MPQAIADDRLRRLYNYWDGLRGSRICPSRREVDPVDIPFMLGRLCLIDVVESGTDFRIRLHGTELARRSGPDLTGSLLSEIPRDMFREQLLVAYREVVETRRPLRLEAVRVLDKQDVAIECLLLPLADDAPTVDTLIHAQIYRD